MLTQTHDDVRPLLEAIEDRYYAQIGNAIRGAGLAACPTARYLTFEWVTDEGQPYLDYRDFLDRAHQVIPESDDDREARRDTFHSLGMGFEGPRDAREACDDVIEYEDRDGEHVAISAPQYVFDLAAMRAVPQATAAVLAATLPVQLLRDAAALAPSTIDEHIDSIRNTIPFDSSAVFMNDDRTSALIDTGGTVISVLSTGETAETATEWTTGWTA